jgi:ABC-type multidrug transport system fused ATPase/permease subunit
MFSVSQDEQTHKSQYSVHHLNVYAVLCFVSLVLVLLTHLSGQYAARRARMVLHRDLLDSILSAPISFFDRMPFGRILNRFSTDTGVIDKVGSYH